MLFWAERHNALLAGETIASPQEVMSSNCASPECKWAWHQLYLQDISHRIPQNKSDRSTYFYVWRSQLQKEKCSSHLLQRNLHRGLTSTPSNTLGISWNAECEPEPINPEWDKNPCSCAPTSGGKPSQKLLQWEILVLASPVQRLIQSVGVHVLLAMSVHLGEFPLTGLRTVRCSLWSVYWLPSDQTMLVPLIYTEESCLPHISFYIAKIIGSSSVASCKNLYILVMLEKKS